MLAAAQQCLLTDCHQEEAACVLIGAVVVWARGGTVVSLGTQARMRAEVGESRLEDLIFEGRLELVFHLCLCSLLGGGETLWVGPNRVPQAGGG